MRPIPNNSGSESDVSDVSENSSSRVFDERLTLIKAANRKIRLIDVLKGLGLKIVPSKSNAKWSYSIICPLPDHKGSKERTPSFAYCFIDDHFHCYGCHSSGRAVEFLALKTGKKKTLVAKQILDKYGSGFEDSSNLETDFTDNVTPMLMETALFLNEKIHSGKCTPEAIEKIEKVIWWLDFYLLYKSISMEDEQDLKYRLDKAKELLQDV
jgi:hypothetical protein